MAGDHHLAASSLSFFVGAIVGSDGEDPHRSCRLADRENGAPCDPIGEQ